MKKSLMKWCSYHGKMEPISNFHKNAFNEDGLQGYCKKGMIKVVLEYYGVHKEPVNKKRAVYLKYEKGTITEKEKNIQVRKINKQYGINSRV